MPTIVWGNLEGRNGLDKQLLVIYDLDIAYGEGLFSYLKQTREFPFEIKLITALDSLSNEETVSLLVLDQALEGIEVGRNIGQIVYLSEGKEDEHHINRYQAMAQIIERLKGFDKSLIEDEIIHVMSKSSRTSLVGIYSPIGGCGKTELARQIATGFARNEETVYYLDFELVSNEEASKEVNFFYDLRERNLFKGENWGQYFMNRNGVYYLASSLYQSELWELNEDDMTYLVQGMREREEQASYIFDIGFLNYAVVRLLRGCDCWVLPYQEGQLAEYKIKNLEKLLHFQEEHELLDRMLQFNVEQGVDELMKRLVL